MSSSVVFRVFVKLIFVFTQFTGHFVLGQGRGAIRLFNKGNTSTLMMSGIVQVYYNSEWTNICIPKGRYNDYLSTLNTASRIVCNQLDHMQGELVTDNTKFGSDTSPSAIMLTSCDGYAGTGVNILRCDYKNSTSTDCNNENDMAVSCLRNVSLEITWYTKLAEFNGFTGSGLVTVGCHKKWGLVCGHGFKQADGNTVCQELGYTDAISIHNTTIPNIDISETPIWIDTPNCARFYYVTCFRFCKECPSTSLTSCPDNQYASVTCSYIDGHRYSDDGNINCESYEIPTASNSTNIGVIVLGVICTCIVVGCIIAVLVGIFVCCYFGVIKKRSRYNQL